MVAACLPLFAQAQSTRDLLEGNLEQAGEEGAGFSTKQAENPLGFVTGVIQAFLSVVGVIFLVLTVYGGYLWMTARGNEQQVEKAKKVLEMGVVGMIVILGAYIISYGVTYWVLRATGSEPATLVTFLPV